MRHKQNRNLLDHDYLLKIINYDKDTGLFNWNNEAGIKKKRTLKAGTITKRGYVQIVICYNHYLAHRLAWFYEYRVWPEEIDHINCIKSDNRICNLRNGTHSENKQNLKTAISSNIATGLLGSYLSKDGYFYGQICIKGKKYYLGAYKTAEEAHEAYVKAKRELHPFGTI